MKFSKRTDWQLGENPLSLALAESRAKGIPIIDLTESNPTRCGFSYPQDVFLTPLAGEENLTYAPHPKGMLKVRQALATYYATKGVRILSDYLVLTSSTSEGYSFLFRLLMDPGDKVLVPAPSYPLFSYLADINDVGVEHYQLRLEDGRWRINFESIEMALDSNVKAIILVSPNNPTGSFIKKDELEILNRLCAAHGVAIICDEVFGDYIFEDHYKDYLTLAGNKAVPTFVLGGLSKALAMPQMKLSWIALNGPADFIDQALPRLELIADTFLSVNTPVQNAAVGWLSNMAVIRDQVMARVLGNYVFLRHICAEKGIGECLTVEGGWYATLHCPSVSSGEEWAIELLRKEGVYVHPGYFFDFMDEGYIVLSLLPERVVFEEGVEKLCRMLQEGIPGKDERLL
ncbi:MAG: pyridoxal phosphate-dependent aminotransferase [Candidatus Omnitrophica bacterium]|nr:pyridoxal phosphate-dependent aminotransferase [Candidatus Omnitrophota bacterium]